MTSKNCTVWSSTKSISQESWRYYETQEYPWIFTAIHFWKQISERSCTSRSPSFHEKCLYESLFSLEPQRVIFDDRSLQIKKICFTDLPNVYFQEQCSSHLCLWILPAWINYQTKQLKAILSLDFIVIFRDSRYK